MLQLSAGPHKVVGEIFLDSFVGGRLGMGIIEQSKIVSAAAKQLAAKVDAVIVAAGFDNNSEGEGADRPFSLPFGQDELIREISARTRTQLLRSPREATSMLRRGSSMCQGLSKCGIRASKEARRLRKFYSAS